MFKGATELKGLSETRTLQGCKKKGKSRVHSATHLDIFILGKEKERLEKVIFVLEKRNNSARKRLEEIAVEVKRLEEAEIREKQATPGVPKSHHKKGWKTMAMTY